jgi:hypothetical protein
MPDDVEDLVFDTATITAESIRDGSEYDGLRLKIRAHLGESDILLQVDVGFGNAIVPGPEEAEVRTLLGDPPPRILSYPRESVVAEKLHALVTLGERNSRYKDFYDLHAMARAFTFERSTLVHAARMTFERRATPITEELPVGLAGPFYSSQSRGEQWRAYVRRNSLAETSQDFVVVGEQVIQFLRPIWNCLVGSEEPRGDWPAGGPWQ